MNNKPIVDKQTIAQVMAELGRRGTGKAKSRGGSGYYRGLQERSAAARRRKARVKA